MTQYKNSTNDTIIQLSSNLLTVNKLPKYNGWESYSEIIIFAIKALNRALKIDRIDRRWFCLDQAILRLIHFYQTLLLLFY